MVQNIVSEIYTNEHYDYLFNNGPQPAGFGPLPSNAGNDSDYDQISIDETPFITVAPENKPKKKGRKEKES